MEQLQVALIIHIWDHTNPTTQMHLSVWLWMHTRWDVWQLKLLLHIKADKYSKMQHVHSGDKVQFPPPYLAFKFYLSCLHML